MRVRLDRAALTGWLAIVCWVIWQDSFLLPHALTTPGVVLQPLYQEVRVERCLLYEDANVVVVSSRLYHEIDGEPQYLGAWAPLARHVTGALWEGY